MKLLRLLIRVGVRDRVRVRVRDRVRVRVSVTTWLVLGPG